MMVTLGQQYNTGEKPSVMLHTYIFSFFFHLTYGRWTSSLPSCLWSQRIFPSLPGSRLTTFLSRCKFSTTLTTRQPMVEFYLLTFLSVTKERTQILLLVRIELTTSVLADVQLTTRPLGRRAIIMTGNNRHAGTPDKNTKTKVCIKKNQNAPTPSA